MNWGIIGLGHMAKNFANAINELDKTSLLGASSRSFFKLINCKVVLECFSHKNCE